MRNENTIFLHASIHTSVGNINFTVIADNLVAGKEKLKSEVERLKAALPLDKYEMSYVAVRNGKLATPFENTNLTFAA